MCVYRCNIATWKYRNQEAAITTALDIRTRIDIETAIAIDIAPDMDMGILRCRCKCI